MAWYWSPNSIPGYAELDRAEQKQAWRAARRQLWKRGPWLLSVVLYIVCFALILGPANWITEGANLGSWASILIICGAAGLASVVATPLFIAGPTAPYLRESIEAIKRQERSQHDV